MRRSGIVQSLKNAAPRPVVDALYAFKYRDRILPTAPIYQDILQGKKGLEIGGPTVVFKGILPIYKSISGLDNINFSNHTLWEGDLVPEGKFYYHNNKSGKQFVIDAVNLGQIPSGAYDFLLSSNCLEHIANPLRAMQEWVRVISPGGHILMVLPRKQSNFDHRRATTAFDHLLEDYNNSVGEDDLSHLDEILELHDLDRDPLAGSPEQFKARSLENISNRCLHHHVFDMPLIEEIFDYFNIKIIQSDVGETDYFAIGSVPHRRESGR